MQLLLLPTSLFLSAAGPQVCSGNWGAEPTFLLMPWVQFIVQVCWTYGQQFGNYVWMRVVSPKCEIYSPDSLPFNAMSRVIHGPGPGSSALWKKQHKLVQGTCNSSSQCSPLLLAFCLRNRLIQDKTGMGNLWEVHGDTKIQGDLNGDTLSHSFICYDHRE